MIKAKLIRFYAVDNSGIFGELIIDEKRFCFTKERLWLHNATNTSCIPAGEYACKRIISDGFGETFMVVDVPYRSEILFHWGSYLKDTKGCILLGTDIRCDSDREMLLLNTKQTHIIFMEKIKDNRFHIEIVDVWKQEGIKDEIRIHEN